MGLVWALVLLAKSCASSPSDYLTARELARVRSWMPQYQAAADLAEVPVLALPAMHYRESDLMETWKVRPEDTWIDFHRRKVPYRNMGGPFMMDQGADGDRVRFDENIRAFERTVAAWFGIAPVPRVRDDFPFSCLCAAYELHEKARGKLFDRRGRVDTDVLAEAFWGYNGRLPARGTWKRSAYVVNDPKRGRQFVIRVGGATGYLDSRPGTLIVYRELERRL